MDTFLHALAQVSEPSLACLPAVVSEACFDSQRWSSTVHKHKQTLEYVVGNAKTIATLTRSTTCGNIGTAVLLLEYQSVHDAHT